MLGGSEQHNYSNRPELLDELTSELALVPRTLHDILHGNLAINGVLLVLPFYRSANFIQIGGKDTVRLTPFGFELERLAILIVGVAAP